MVCLGWWTVEILTLLSGYISVDSTAAQIIMLNISSLLFMVPLGFSFAAATLVGNSIGEYNIPKAKKYA